MVSYCRTDIVWIMMCFEPMCTVKRGVFHDQGVDIVLTLHHQVMAVHLGVENGTVRYVAAGEDVMGMLWSSNVVVYGSFRDEQSFPPILSRAMSLHRLVVAPNRSTFRDQVRLDGWWWNCILDIYCWVSC